MENTENMQPVPELPEEPAVLIADDVQEKLQGWIDYIQGFSPHIAIRSVLDPDFNRQEFIEKLRGFLFEMEKPDNNERLEGICAEDIVMVIGLPETLLAKKKFYRFNDGLILCLYNKSVFIKHRFDYDEYDSCGTSVRSYSPIYSEWKKDLKILVGDLRKLIDEVPKPPNGKPNPA